METNMTIALSAVSSCGTISKHWPREQPAWTEHGLAVQWVSTIKNFLEDYTNVVVVPEGILEEKSSWLAQQESKVDIVVEVRFGDAGLGKARGSETLYHPDSHIGKIAALCVQGGLGYILQPNLGIREGWVKTATGKVVDEFLCIVAPIVLVVIPEFIHNAMTISKFRNIGGRLLAEGLLAAQVELEKRGDL